MHEFSLVHALLEQVDTLRREQSADRVTSICVSVGEFSGVEPELFRGAYEILVEETFMRGAKLQMNRVPLESCCSDCGQNFTVQRFRFECPRCRSRKVNIVRGQELLLENITIEQSTTEL